MSSGQLGEPSGAKGLAAHSEPLLLPPGHPSNTHHIYILILMVAIYIVATIVLRQTDRSKAVTEPLSLQQPNVLPKEKMTKIDGAGAQVGTQPVINKS